jgi:hypothetical protein
MVSGCDLLSSRGSHEAARPPNLNAPQMPPVRAEIIHAGNAHEMAEALRLELQREFAGDEE